MLNTHNPGAHAVCPICEVMQLSEPHFRDRVTMCAYLQVRRDAQHSGSGALASKVTRPQQSRSARRVSAEGFIFCALIIMFPV